MYASEASRSCLNAKNQNPVSVVRELYSLRMLYEEMFHQKFSLARFKNKEALDLIPFS
jgi:hypothetical protein